MPLIYAELRRLALWSLAWQADSARHGDNPVYIFPLIRPNLFVATLQNALRVVPDPVAPRQLAATESGDAVLLTFSQQQHRM